MSAERVRIGIIGLGFMGRTHAQAYAKIDGAEIVAIADVDPQRAKGDLSDSWGNVGDESGLKFDMDVVRGTTDFHELIGWDNVDVVDICVPTPLHVELAVAALAAGKHVVVEKPMAVDSSQAGQIVAAAAEAQGFLMPAMCIRFWPQWSWLKQAVVERRYGAVHSAIFRRVAQMPPGWFQDGEKSGGAVMDLHIHDTDFVYYLFGQPRAVFSRGYSKSTSRIDHLVTQYIYDDVPIVAAEGSWAMADGFAFNMAYTVNFENATADYDLSRSEQPLTVSQDGNKEAVDCGDSDGWTEELRYMVDCLINGRRPETITPQDALASILIAEAEARSVASGTLETP
ncbi:MAG: Gfo/Idh/MocA family oxidoreductase [Planctomycetota bacterium]|nr:Gfo/Idh/MocA family oxidoreductase [Planctomycetota bacterium]